MKRAREPENALETQNLDTMASESDVTDEMELPASKVAELDMAIRTSSVIITCSLPPHKEPLVFKTYKEYESHYNGAHTNRCVECRKNFPSSRLLDIHIEECHDSFVAFSCFVEGCDRKCLTPQKRRLHLIDKHMYPRNFFFAITRDGIDGRRSLLLEAKHRSRQKVNNQPSDAAQPLPVVVERGDNRGTAGALQPQVEAAARELQPPDPDDLPEVDMEDITGAMAAFQFVPPSVRFGRGGRKGGFAKR